MLHSLLRRHAGLPVRIDYLHGPDTSRGRRARLQAMVESLGGDIVFHHLDRDLTFGLPVTGYAGRATWYRTFLPELLPDAERVLYLDSDLLVLDSLLPLWHTSLEDHLLGAVSNVLQRHDFERPMKFGLPGKERYFNGGVMLMNLELMRSEHSSEFVLSYARENPELVGWWDQDALNAVLHDRRLDLPPRWNCTNSVMHFPWAEEYFTPAELDAARIHPAIRHFEGPAANKPWHLLCEPEGRRLYRDERRHTPWPRVWPDGASPANLLQWMRARRAQFATRS